MKVVYFLIILVVITFDIESTSAQDLDSAKSRNKGVLIRLDGPNSMMKHHRVTSPLYVVSVDNKSMQIPSDGNLTDSLAVSASLKYINLDWIESVNVMKVKEVTEKYNSLGRNGVILIDLKKGSLEKMPPDFRNKFQGN